MKVSSKIKGQRDCNSVNYLQNNTFIGLKKHFHNPKIRYKMLNINIKANNEFPYFKLNIFNRFSSISILMLLHVIKMDLFFLVKCTLLLFRIFPFHLVNV